MLAICAIDNAFQSIKAVGSAPVNTALPGASGPAIVGQVENASTGSWANSPTSYSYQWQVNGINGTGAGATTNMYTPASVDVGKMLTVIVTANNAFGSAQATSLPVGPVGSAVLFTDPATVALIRQLRLMQ